MSHGGPPLWRCVRCGCPATDHATDDEERRECSRCECTQYECDALATSATAPSALDAALAAWRARPESDRGIAEHYLRVEADWRLAKMRTTARDHDIAATLRAAVALLGAAGDEKREETGR